MEEQPGRRRWTAWPNGKKAHRCGVSIWEKGRCYREGSKKNTDEGGNTSGKGRRKKPNCMTGQKVQQKLTIELLLKKKRGPGWKSVKPQKRKRSLGARAGSASLKRQEKPRRPEKNLEGEMTGTERPPCRLRRGVDQKKTHLVLQQKKANPN